MPLAFVHAAAYIKRLTGRFTVKQYIRQFRQDDKERRRLLATKGTNYVSETKASNSVMTTWHISFEYLRNHCESAAMLLCLMSFFDRQGIQESLLRVRTIHGWENEEDCLFHSHTAYKHDWEKDTEASGAFDTLASGAMDESRFDEDVTALQDFAFVSWKQSQNDVFNKHALVQFATRRQLSEEEVERSQVLAVRKLHAKFPHVDFEHFEECLSFYPHAVAGLNRPPKDDESLEKWAYVLERAIGYDYHLGRTVQGMVLNEKILNTRWQLFGPVHKLTIRSRSMSASLLRDQGKWDEARNICEEILQDCRNELGLNRSDTIAAMLDLAAVYTEQEKYDQAEKLFMEAGP